MKVGPKLSIRVLIIIIAVFYCLFVYFIFSENLNSLFLEIVAVLIGLFYIHEVVEIFSLYIKIEGLHLKVRSIIPIVINTSMVSTRPREFVFLLSDIQSISVEYKKEYYKKTQESIRDKYLGKGRAIMVVKTKDAVADVYLDSFSVKDVKKFIKSNFENK